MPSAASVSAFVPSLENHTEVGLGVQLDALKRGRLWAAYATSSLIIGATFAAFQ